MYKLIRGEPIEKINFSCFKAKNTRYKNKMVCDDIFTFDTETTSDFLDENGQPFMFDYDDPKKAQDAEKHSVCYLWQFGINETTRYIGRNLYEFCDLLYLLNQYCPHLKFLYIHNLSFDFNFLQNVMRFDNVFARKPRHPLTARCFQFNVEFRCSYTLTNLSLEMWAKSNNLKATKHVGQLKYNVMRTPLTPLTDDEIDYAIADLDVMFYGLQIYKEQYGGVYAIPMTHTGKMRQACAEVMKTEGYYCERATSLMPQTLEDYIEQADAFVGGSVFCNWIYKDRLIEDVEPYDIASSYPWVLINNKYPMTPFRTVPLGKIEQYKYNPKYLYIVRFNVVNMVSNYNCHFMSRSKALKLQNVQTDNGRIICADYAEFVLTSVDFELFEKLYDGKITVTEFRVCRAGYLNDKFRKFIIDLYKDKTTLKGVEGMEQLYQNKKEYINSAYGDFVTKIFSDEIVYDFSNKQKIWGVEELDEVKYEKKLNSLNRKKYSNYKAFCQGIFVTAHARARIWNAVLQLDENIVYSDTDSLKLFNYNGSYFEEQNKVVLTRHKEIADALKIDINDLSPVDVKGKKHPIGIWEKEEHAVYFKSLGCKQYLWQGVDGVKHLTCAGVSKLAVQCFDTFDKFETDTKLTEKQLKNCTDGKGHTAEKLTPYYSVDYPTVIYPDGYKCTYKCGVCLMPTTFKLSITPNDIKWLVEEMRNKFNKAYYKRS